MFLRTLISNNFQFLNLENNGLVEESPPCSTPKRNKDKILGPSNGRFSKQTPEEAPPAAVDVRSCRVNVMSSCNTKAY